MRRVATLCGLILVLAFGASAQIQPANSLLLGSKFPALAVTIPPSGPEAFAAALPEPTPAPPAPQGVYGVVPAFNFEVYGGFSYFHFYELPGITGSLDGFNVGISYYPKAGHLGVDGEFEAAFAPQNGVSTTLDAGLGGVKYRLLNHRGDALWVHGLVGGAHFVPLTPYGGESALAVEAGGGLDVSPKNGRLSYRIEADVLGTYFFGTYQYSPKISVGVVYKF